VYIDKDHLHLCVTNNTPETFLSAIRDVSDPNQRRGLLSTGTQDPARLSPIRDENEVHIADVELTAVACWALLSQGSPDRRRAPRSAGCCRRATHPTRPHPTRTTSLSRPVTLAEIRALAWLTDPPFLADGGSPAPCCTSAGKC
jgi:hypothetical protein